MVLIINDRTEKWLFNDDFKMGDAIINIYKRKSADDEQLKESFIKKLILFWLQVVSHIFLVLNIYSWNG